MVSCSPTPCQNEMMLENKMKCIACSCRLMRCNQSVSRLCTVLAAWSLNAVKLQYDRHLSGYVSQFSCIKKGSNTRKTHKTSVGYQILQLTVEECHFRSCITSSQTNPLTSFAASSQGSLLEWN